MVLIDSNKENNLSKKSAADCFQIRSVSESRFIKKIGIVSEEIINQIEVALKVSLRFK